tara:strand:+ start:620 stop:856 length:237 start_codon:yes stop_codon:yes gene_type:complete
MNEQIEFRLVNDEDVPPLVFTMDDNDRPKIIINRHYAIWLMVNRNIIPSSANAIADEIYNLLDAHLAEMRANELMEYD